MIEDEVKKELKEHSKIASKVTKLTLAIKTETGSIINKWDNYCNGSSGEKYSINQDILDSDNLELCNENGGT